MKPMRVIALVVAVLVVCAGFAPALAATKLKLPPGFTQRADGAIIVSDYSLFPGWDEWFLPGIFAGVETQEEVDKLAMEYFGWSSATGYVSDFSAYALNGAGELGDHSVPLLALGGLALIAMGGVVFFHHKRKAVALR